MTDHADDHTEDYKEEQENAKEEDEEENPTRTAPDQTGRAIHEMETMCT